MLKLRSPGQLRGLVCCVVVVAAAAACVHILLAGRSLHASVPLQLNDAARSVAGGGDDDVDYAASSMAAVDQILALRGDEIKFRRPLADLILPSSNHCAVDLSVSSGISTDAAIEKTLAELFNDASGFWAADAEEVAAVAQGSGVGPPATCTEATYGEITVEGLRAVLESLALALVPSLSPLRPDSPPSPASLLVSSDGGVPSPGLTTFDAMIDLGAGTGRTATASVLLGFTRRAFGVELGPQRFALGCQALSAAAPAASPSAASLGPGVARLAFLRGDARAWPELAANHGWPLCGPRWVLFLGAACFREALLASIARAIERGCRQGVGVAILGHRFPASVLAETAAAVRLMEIGSVRAKTTWSSGSEVFLYQLMSN